MNDPRQARAQLLEAIRLLDADDVAAGLEALASARRGASLVSPAAWAVVPSWKDDGAWTRVVDALERALDRAEQPALHLALGEALAAAGCPDAALAELAGLEDAPATDPTQLELARASAWDLLGRRDLSAPAWRRVAAALPADPVAVRRVDVADPRTLAIGGGDVDADLSRPLARGRALLVDGRYDEATAVLQSAADAQPTVEAWSWLARAQHALGDARAATEALARARRLRGGPRATVGLADALRTVAAPDAVDVARGVLDAGSDDPVVLAACADVLERSGEPARALQAADAALAIDAAFLPARVVRARALATLDRVDAAKDAWKAVLELQPGHPEGARAREGRNPKTERGVARIHHDLGRAMFQRGRYREAVNAFRNAAEIRPEWADPWRQLGLTWLQLDERTAALEAFRTALEVDPDDVESAVRLGTLQREQGALQVALMAYDRALALQPVQVEALLGRGEVRRLMGAFDGAVPDFEAALRTVPDDAFGLCGLAASLNGLRRFAEARPVWMRAREHDPNSTFVAKGLAQCHAGLRGSALLAFEDVSREAQPRRVVPWVEQDPVYDRYKAMDQVERGRSYHKERNFAAAIESFKKALEIDPTCDEAALRLGMAYEDDRQFRRAIAAYRTCLEIEPNHYQAAANIGEAYRKNEQYREAVGAYDEALRLKADYLYALAGRAECMRMLGRYEDCVPWFDKALAMGPSHAFAIQGKAAALNALQRFQEALPYWTKAIELEPDSQFAADGKAYCEAQLKRLEGDRPAPAAPTPTDEDVVEEDEVESATPTLDEQGRDLTALARQGKLPKVVGRDREIRQVMKTLVRRLKANPLLLGEPGVGKTAVVEGLAQRLADGDAPERLASLRIVELSMGSLIAGTKYRGTFEERLREIVKEATTVPGLVLFIDEIHTLVGAGRTEGGSLDAANILKPALARGEITVIGATTHAEYRRHFETDSALERRFQPITVDEPTPDAAVALLRAVAPVYARHHEVRIEPEALDACVQMSVRFLPDRRLPDKALDMLDEACADASLSDEGVVDRDVVARVVSERTGVPVRKLTAADRERMDDMERFLGQRVLGQDDAVRRLAAAVRLSRSGLRAHDRPRAVFLFRGASGVGKTELAKALADFLFPEGDALVRLDMSEYSDRFTTSRLLGAPPGYAGHGEQGQLTGPLRRKPYCVVLLDEFEKAHPDVQAIFLSLLDEGLVTDADGRQVNAREAYFILTTNAGADVRSASRMGFGGGAGEDEDAAARKALEPWFRPELLDRLDEIIGFRDLDDAALREIARARMGRLVARAAEHRITLRWDDDVLDFVLARRRAGERGARQTIRAVDTAVGEPLGRHLLALGEAQPRTLSARVVDGALRFDEAQPPTPKAPKPAPV